MEVHLGSIARLSFFVEPQRIDHGFYFVSFELGLDPIQKEKEIFSLLAEGLHAADEIVAVLNEAVVTIRTHPSLGEIDVGGYLKM